MSKITKEELDFRVNCTLSKGRNIAYYRLIDDRPRCQYIHVMRKYRQEVYELIKFIRDSGMSEMYSSLLVKLNKVIDLISPKIKSDDCFEVAMELNKIFNYE